MATETKQKGKKRKYLVVAFFYSYLITHAQGRDWYIMEIFVGSEGSFSPLYLCLVVLPTSSFQRTVGSERGRGVEGSAKLSDPHC